MDQGTTDKDDERDLGDGEQSSESDPEEEEEEEEGEEEDEEEEDLADDDSRARSSSLLRFYLRRSLRYNSGWFSGDEYRRKRC